MSAYCWFARRSKPRPYVVRHVLPEDHIQQLLMGHGYGYEVIYTPIRRVDLAARRRLDRDMRRLERRAERFVHAEAPFGWLDEMEHFTKSTVPAAAGLEALGLKFGALSDAIRKKL